MFLSTRTHRCHGIYRLDRRRDDIVGDALTRGLTLPERFALILRDHANLLEARGGQHRLNLVNHRGGGHQIGDGQPATWLQYSKLIDVHGGFVWRKVAHNSVLRLGVLGTLGPRRSKANWGNAR